MRYLLILITVLPIHLLSQSDIFSGKIRYELIPIRKIDLKDTQAIGSNLFKLFSDTIYTEVLINRKRLVSISKSRKGEIVSVFVQNEDDIYMLDIFNFKHRINFKDIPGNLHNIKASKKTDETKSLLGILCRKYIYAVDGNIFNVWLPENLLYLKQRSYGGFFDNYFFPNGLAFEKESILESTNEKIHVLRICKIEIFRPTDEDFENFVEEAKKQSNCILKMGAKE